MHLFIQDIAVDMAHRFQEFNQLRVNEAGGMLDEFYYLLSVESANYFY